MSNIAPRITYPSYKRPNPASDPASKRAPTPEALRGLWHLWVDCPITRRKRFSQVENPEGEVVFIDRQTGPCLAYLEAEAQSEYILHTETSEFLVRLERLLKEKGPH